MSKPRHRARYFTIRIVGRYEEEGVAFCAGKECESPVTVEILDDYKARAKELLLEALEADEVEFTVHHVPPKAT